MNTAVTVISLRTPSIKCRICGRKALHGAKLCGECVAAVRRARNVGTITSQFLPALSLPTAGAVRVATSTRPRAAVARRRLEGWLPSGASGWGAVAAFALFAATVGVIGYSAVTEIEDEAAIARAGHATPDLTPGGTASAPVNESRETWMFAPAAAVDGAVTAGTGVASESLPTSFARRSPMKPGVDARAPKPTPASSDSRPYGTLEPTEAATTSQDDGPAVAVASPIAPIDVPVAPPVPDRWQSMNEALARCAGEGFLAGVICGERVRLQYCDGNWGQVPQCRVAARPENSR